MGRVDITTLASGDIAISWMDNSEQLIAQIMAAKYSPEVELLNKVKVAETQASRPTGFPSITASGNDIYLSWTDVGETKQVETARVPL